MNTFFNRIYTSNWQSSVLAGILLGLSFPPFNLFLLSIPAFMLLFRITDRSTSARQVMYFTYPAFLIWNIITTYWLTFATITGGVAAILANSALMTLPLAGIYHIRRSSPGLILSALSSASMWVIYEFLHYRWDLSWPWLTLGNAFSNAPILVQYASVTGVMGVSFWVVMVASILQNNATTPMKTLTQKISYWPYSLIIFALPIWSVVIHVTYNLKPESVVEVVVAQPNYDSYLHNAGYNDINVALEELIQLTDSVRTSQTKFVFWPENALMHNIIHYSTQHPVNRLLGIASEWNVNLISGATWYKYYDGDDHPRVYKEYSNGQKFEVYNASVGFSPSGEILVYEKANLVPIVERIPFLDFFGRFKNPWVDWRRVPSYGKGSSLINYEIDGIKSPALICYDSVFPDWNRRFVKEGADFITVITNDGWWGNSSGHIQHFDFARMRAIETRRTVIRSANNGISGMIYASGKVHSKTDYWTKDALRLAVPLHGEITFYVRFGDWIGYLSLIILLITAIHTRGFMVKSIG
jgi:apolipoprotein N-acyltransferase